MRSNVLGAGKDGQRQFGNQKLLGNGRMYEKSPNFGRVGLLRRFSDKISVDFVRSLLKLLTINVVESGSGTAWCGHSVDC